MFYFTCKAGKLCEKILRNFSSSLNIKSTAQYSTRHVHAYKCVFICIYEKCVCVWKNIDRFKFRYENTKRKLTDSIVSSVVPIRSIW